MDTRVGVKRAQRDDFASKVRAILSPQQLLVHFTNFTNFFLPFLSVYWTFTFSFVCWVEFYGGGVYITN